jgi:hypothetical protein
MGPDAFELLFTFFGYEDDDEVRARRIKLANALAGRERRRADEQCGEGKPQTDTFDDKPHRPKPASRRWTRRAASRRAMRRCALR